MKVEEKIQEYLEQMQKKFDRYKENIELLMRFPLSEEDNEMIKLVTESEIWGLWKMHDAYIKAFLEHLGEDYIGDMFVLRKEQ